MEIFLSGHSYKYAAEQMLLTLFPEQRTVYVSERPRGDGVTISLRQNERTAAARTSLRLGGKSCSGRAQVASARLKDEITTDSLLQKIIKLSFFRAAMKAGVKCPPWGALTGIRPGKIVLKLFESGKSPVGAERVLANEYYVSPERARLCVETASESLAAKKSLLPRDICLYIGIPFCPTRCSYCSFVSHSVEKSTKLIEPYLENLSREIKAAGVAVKEAGARVVSVYIGGGTPTTLSAQQLLALHADIEASFDLSSLREYTVEAGRPDTITPEKLAALRSAGVTRISINPQTMQDGVLEAIGRRHTAAQAEEAFELAAKYGFSCVNADLIAGLPSDSADGFMYSLEKVLSFSPENVTVHDLSLKRGARLGGETDRAIPPDEEIGRMFSFAMETLRGKGYSPYYLYRQKFMAGGFENVGWTKPGKINLYNICIMEELCTILALGAGGSTKLVNPTTGRIKRVFNPKYPYEYNRDIEKVIANKVLLSEFYKEEGL